MFCPKCGTEILTDAKFCFQCGFKISDIKSSISKDFDTIAEDEYDAEKLYSLFKYYSDQKSKEYNAQKARFYLEKAADKGHKYAILVLLCEEDMYPSQYREKDSNKKFHWAKIGAEAGHTLIMEYLADYYLAGIGTKANFDEAVRWLTIVYESGDLYANPSVRLADIYMGDSKDRDKEKHIDLSKASYWCDKAAEKGNAKPYSRMARIYLIDYKTYGIEQNIPLAISFYEKMAEAGDNTGIKSLVDLYEKGDVLPANIDEEMKWRRELAKIRKTKKGKTIYPDIEDALSLGNIYSEGKKVKKDILEAAKWYEYILHYEIDLCDGKNLSLDGAKTLDACGRLYSCYIKTNSKFEIWKKFLEYCHRLESIPLQGAGRLMHILGLLYQEGHGTAANMDRAIEYYSKGVKFDNMECAAKLGMIYTKGDGVKSNELKAYSYFCMAYKIKATPLVHHFLMYYELSEKQEIMEMKFSNKNCYEIPLGNFNITYESEISAIGKLNYEFSQAISSIIKKFESFYKEQENIDNVVEKAFGYGKRLILEAGNIGVSYCSQCKIYDVTAQDFTEDSSIYIYRNTPISIWKNYFLRIQNAYSKIVNSAQTERDYRAEQKENRTMVIGGGFGFSGALKGMLQAGAINMLTGVAYPFGSG